MNPTDAWIDAIPENVYDPCPCGCGKKFKFALKEDIEQHEKQFVEKFLNALSSLNITCSGSENG
jgi:hypothetical protein